MNDIWKSLDNLELIEDGALHHMGIKMYNIAMIYGDRIVEIESSNSNWIRLYQ